MGIRRALQKTISFAGVCPHSEPQHPQYLNAPKRWLVDEKRYPKGGSETLGSCPGPRVHFPPGVRTEEGSKDPQAPDRGAVPTGRGGLLRAEPARVQSPLRATPPRSPRAAPWAAGAARRAALLFFPTAAASRYECTLGPALRRLARQPPLGFTLLPPGLSPRRLGAHRLFQGWTGPQGDADSSGQPPAARGTRRGPGAPTSGTSRVHAVSVQDLLNRGETGHQRQLFSVVQICQHHH